ncbi:3-oxoacyl-ACP reductase FabG [Streptomyces sp. CT34]|uniref:SDR family NAD(P)-dependent oxidoreductase n=1 Tax=Streptomyces sp. CT34 TaxID=1553907 RepID=UPI0005BBDA70|nr:3-oxoacyl-ACP reductase FabG [Streptomyces sp. CT34]
MTDFDGRVALVTGATKGIGLAVATDLARAGATVLINYRRNPDRAQEALHAVRQLRPDAELLQGDIAEPADVDRMFRHIRSRHGGLDALVHNAGITQDGYAVMMGDAKWRRVIDTNLTGAFLCTRAAGRMMAARRRGSIVTIGSTRALNPPAGQANYAASKAGVLAMVKALAKELGGYGVRVNAVVPGFVDTAMTRQMPPAQLAENLRRVPLGRIGRPAEVSAVVRFLLSDEAAYVTGTSVVVDGGLIS